MRSVRDIGEVPNGPFATLAPDHYLRTSPGRGTSVLAASTVCRSGVRSFAATAPALRPVALAMALLGAEFGGWRWRSARSPAGT